MLWLIVGFVANRTAIDPLSWHEHETVEPVMTINGLYTTEVWRRQKPDGSWEYRVRQDGFDAFNDERW